MARSVSVGELAAAIASELEDYRQDVTDQLKADVKQVAKETVREIRDTSPVMDGDYQKGWSSTVNHESREDVRITVFNRTNYQLTHLLEDGHAIAGGGSVAARPHIGPAEEHAAEKLEAKVKVNIRKR